MMDIKNYLQEFTKMVDELKAHPKVMLLSFHVFEPATENDISEVEKQLGFSLDEDLKTFYRQCNGLQLRWAHLDNPSWDRNELTGFVPGPFTYQDVLDDAGTIDGCVNILPIKEVFLTDWEKRFGRFDPVPEIVTVGSTVFSYDEYAKHIKLFNLYHPSASESIFCSQELGYAVVCGLSEHQIFTRSYRYSINAYLDLLTTGKGSISFASMFMDHKKGLIQDVVSELPSVKPYNLNRSSFS